MRVGRFAFLLAFSLSLFSRPAWPQESPQPELAERLREILRQYESNIADLKSRIEELESLLSDSEARSTSLLEDLRASRAELSSLTEQYERLATRLDEYRIQLEDSRRLTSNSLGSLTVSMGTLRTQALIQSSGMALALIAMLFLIFR